MPSFWGEVFYISTRYHNLIFFHPIYSYFPHLYLKAPANALKADQYLCSHADPTFNKLCPIHTGCSCFSHSTKQTINAGQ